VVREVKAAPYGPVTYLQHHDHDTKTYPEGEWEYVLGGLETIDREFGYGVDNITHHITDCHVAHHMFSDMPHYRLPAATEGVGNLSIASSRRSSTHFIRPHLSCFSSLTRLPTEAIHV
jgi:fatty acid desaturase